MAEGTKPDSLALVGDAESIERWVKDCLNDLVPTERPASAVHQDKFVLVVYEVRLELRLQSPRHRMVFSDSSVLVVTTCPCQKDVN